MQISNQNVGVSQAETQLFLKTSFGTNIKQGSTVFVRILADNNNGTYDATFIGHKFTINSQQKYTAGENFFANIISLKKSGEQFFIHLEKISEQNLSSLLNIPSTLLEQTGLPVNELSHKILAFFTELKIKPDISKMHKAYKIAIKFGSNAKKAADIALQLLEKGIEPDEENVSKVLFLTNELGNDDFDSTGQKNHGDKDNDLLKFINSAKTSERTWLIFPFDFTISEENGKGCAKILVNLNRKNTEKIAIFFKISSKIFNFMLYYSSTNFKKIDKVEFCEQPFPSEKTEKRHIQMLKDLLKSHQVENVEFVETLSSDVFFPDSADNFNFEGKYV